MNEGISPNNFIFGPINFDVSLGVKLIPSHKGKIKNFCQKYPNCFLAHQNSLNPMALQIRKTMTL